MNRLSRHELAERTFISRYARRGARAVRASTTAPFDLLLVRPEAGRLTSVFVEIKTARGRVTSDLSGPEREFGRFAEAHGSPYLLARYRVSGESVLSEELHRPFSPGPEAEIVLEIH